MDGKTNAYQRTCQERTGAYYACGVHTILFERDPDTAERLPEAREVTMNQGVRYLRNFVRRRNVLPSAPANESTCLQFCTNFASKPREEKLLLTAMWKEKISEVDAAAAVEGDEIVADVGRTREERGAASSSIRLTIGTIRLNLNFDSKGRQSGRGHGGCGAEGYKLEKARRPRKQLMLVC